MDNMGFGAMIHMLSGGSKNPPDKYYGRKIVDADVNEQRLEIKFEDGITIHLWDDGQSCCEHRYITCDDPVGNIIGGKLVEIKVKEHKQDGDEYDGCHEQVFIDVQTDQGFLTMCTHNVHNGYYGGFGLTIDEVQ